MIIKKNQLPRRTILLKLPSVLITNLRSKENTVDSTEVETMMINEKIKVMEIIPHIKLDLVFKSQRREYFDGSQDL